MNPSPYAYPGMKGVAIYSITHKPSIEEVFDRVCKKFLVNSWELKSDHRQKHIAEARHVIMYFLMVENGIGCVAIGRLFNRDHTSVLYAKKRITGYLEKYPEYKELMDEIKYGCGSLVGSLKIPKHIQEVNNRPPAEYSNSGFLSVTEKYIS